MNGPFYVERKGPSGPDSAVHTFCVIAKANSEAIRLKYSDLTAAINGASSSDDGKSARRACEKLAKALNQVFAQYMEGYFHDDAPSVATRF